jgi:hypothetical protein
MKKVLGLLLFLVFSSSAHAACTGSGTTWSCPAGASSTDVQNAINSASDGSTITFASGAYTWSSKINFSPSAGTTLICASAGACTVSGGTVLGTSAYSGTNTHFYRISGFVFNATGSGFVIWFGSGCSGCTGSFTQVRVDHNQFNLPAGSVAVFFGESTSVTNTYGVVDHNTVTSSGSVQILNMIGSAQSTPPSSQLGTGNNMFVEDNTINITTMTNSGDGCMDSWGGAAIVWRHNTSTNCLVTAHGVTHAGGPNNIELYNNTIQVNSGSSSAGVSDCYRCFHHQGSGTFIAYNNVFSATGGHNGDAIAMAHYRDFASGTSIDGGTPPCDGTQSRDGNRSPGATWYGYPCWHQPGRDPATGSVKPMYAWNNSWSDTHAQINLTLEDFGGSAPPSCTIGSGGNCDYFAVHMKYDRDAYNAVSASAQTSPLTPFAGVTGMGFGTLANRPPTCITNVTESGSGVGYFATDTNTLYTCSAANTWTVYYTQYTYPHPLTNGGTKTSTPPPTPNSLNAIVQ